VARRPEENRDEAGAVVRLRPASGPAVDDAELVRRIRAGGDAWAEETLYRRHAERLHRVVLRMLGRRADAEDVLQDTFVTAFDRLGDLRDPAAVSGWLLRIAVRQVHRRLRRRQVRRWLGLDEEGAEVQLDPAPGATPEERELCAELAAILSAVPAAERIAWMLHKVEGHTLEESAVAAGCSLATVKRRISAAHAIVRRSIEIGEVP
jgi:RNA polymerase sigma-70 factor (ECF subfamily)